MGQYKSRISIIYKDIFTYSFAKEKLSKIDIEKYGFSGTGDILFKPKGEDNISSINDFSCTEDELVSLIEKIYKIFRRNAIVIADTINYNEDLSTKLVYCFGYGPKTLYLDNIVLEDIVDINNIPEWLEYVKNDITDKEYKVLRDFRYKLKFDNKPTKSKKYKYHGLIYASFKNDEDAKEAYNKWIIYIDEQGNKKTISDLKEENNSLGDSDTNYKNFLIDEIPISVEECTSYLTERIDIFKKGAAIALTYNGVDNKVFISYYFGDKIKKIEIDNDEIKELIQEDCTISECLIYNNIEKLFQDKYSILTNQELKRIEECNI